MYDIMTEEESFLKCLCKSIIEFLICNFSWKWPCSNKSSQITEYQTHGASCLFLIILKNKYIKTNESLFLISQVHTGFSSFFFFDVDHRDNPHGK